MPGSPAPAELQARLARFRGFLQADPGNLRLIGDAAQAAMEAGEIEEATVLLERYAAKAPLPPALVNLEGLVAIAAQRFDQASAVFSGLLRDNPDDPILKFNLAWLKAMLSDWAGADALLDEAVTAAVPRAAGLKIQVLHHLGRLEDALGLGAALAERHPRDEALMSALAVVAIDAEEAELARTYAERAGPTHEGLSTLGLLELNAGHLDKGLALFDQALNTRADDARALLGKGLGLMAKGDPAGAAGYIDRAAESFDTHLGSWVAAGWAYFVQGDYATARKRFDAALARDDAFAEIHGGLAVLDIAEGDIEGAERRTEVALRLDRNCFSAALARMLLLSARGDTATAEKVRDLALSTPIGAGGRTLAQTIMALGVTSPKPVVESRPKPAAGQKPKPRAKT